jgi:hypothetical protein
MRETGHRKFYPRAAEARRVVILELLRGHSARNPREGSSGTEVAITVQWVSAWSLGSAGVLDELSPCAFFV